MLRQYAMTYAELKQEFENFKKETNAKFDKNDKRYIEVFQLLDELITKKRELEKPRNPIGFRIPDKN
jgi:hypothetical protein